MKALFYALSAVIVICAGLISCQRPYMDDTEDIETSTIQFKSLTASRDSACMFDTVILVADAVGENLKYEWQRAKGSLVPVREEPNKAYFWGCMTCVGRLTISCTVSNEFGSYTKNVDIFVWPWRKTQGRFPGWEKYIDRFGQW